MTQVKQRRIELATLENITRTLLSATMIAIYPELLFIIGHSLYKVKVGSVKMGIKILDDESGLLAKIVKGDERAFRIVFNTYQKKIYSSALQMLRDEVLAEEVVQVSMLKLWMMGTGLLEIKNLQSYLIRISRNYAFDLLRRKEMQLKAERNIQVTWSEEHNETEEQILLNETRKILQDGIDLLPPQQKIVYQLCHQEGLKYEEAASELNLSVETIRSYMRLAQRFLRNHLRSNSDIAVLLIIFKLF